MHELAYQMLDRKRRTFFVDGSQVSIESSDIFGFAHKEMKFHDGNANERI
ncbi:hypothetical protein PDN23_22945 [Bacillus cereus]|nr:hypothetical protein [Bacillus cereus]